jgi:hypothetical protein
MTEEEETFEATMQKLFTAKWRSISGVLCFTPACNLLRLAEGEKFTGPSAKLK